MGHSTLINATDLNRWSSSREAQGKLPQLMRRLIRETTRNLQKISFPSEEGVQMGGWDGVVSVEVGNDFVPNGFSGWELGTSRDIKGKADDDYGKRTTNPDEIDPAKTTFIFVTPRRWGGKDNWIDEKVKEGKWRDVRAYDADDLEAFLETAPVAHIWASILLGKRPEGAIDIANYWEEWRSVTRPQTTPALVIGGRQEELNRVFEWLQAPPSCLSLQAETQDEAVAFAVSCIQLLPEEVRANFLERSVVVETEVEWRRLCLFPEALLLIPTFANRSIVGSALERGHHVLLPIGLTEAATNANVALNRPHRDAVSQALAEMQIANSQIDDLATLGRRSLSALRRRLAVNPAVLIPQWAQPSDAHALLPALLVGRWNDSSEGDRKIIAQLAGCEYSQVSEVLLRWANTSYPFVRRVGDTWLVVSKEDSWLLLSRFLTTDDLLRFEEASLEVLGQASPHYELEIEQRPMASLLGKTLPHSGHLREGIAETLALMAARSDVAVLADAHTGQDWADRIIHELFSEVTTWEHWASLDSLLVPLAEASPDNFLNAVDSIVRGEEPIAVDLFRQEDPQWAGPVHSGLLWALELLAWSPDYLTRAAIHLARLTRLDPDSTLREIFLSWHPSTTATLEQRLKVIDQIRKRDSDVAWNLMVNALPYGHRVADSTQKPDWREWNTDEAPGVTWPQVLSSARQLVERLLQDVGTDEKRWSSLISLLDNLGDEQFGILVEKLRGTVKSQNEDEAKERFRAQLRDSIRKILSHHLSYPEAQWAISKERIEQLQEVYVSLEPRDLVARHAWQFSNRPRFMLAETEDWRERYETIDKTRAQAVREIYDAGGLTDILRLAEQSDDAHRVGSTLGALLSLGAEEDPFLTRTLGSAAQYLVLLGQGYCRGRLAKDASWIRSQLEGPAVSQGTDLQRANFYLCLNCDQQTWDLVKKAGVEVERLYWAKVGVLAYSDFSEIDLQHFIESLAAHGRLTEALHHMSAQSYAKEQRLPPSFLMAMLETAIGKPEEVDWKQLGHDVPHLLKVIEDSKEISDDRLGRVEFLFLSWLEYSEYQPKALMRSLNENPDFFCDLIKLAFRGENDDQRQLSEEERSRAHLAYDLLRLWRTLPGSDLQGNIDADTLSRWVASAIQLVSNCGRRAAGEHQIGQLLSHSPIGTDGCWPHEAVRRVLEETSSEQLERGFQIGTSNNLGVTSRSLTEGGAQEREIATRYREASRTFRDDWPRTSAVLNRMAEQYERDARGEDIDADLNQDLWR